MKNQKPILQRHDQVTRWPGGQANGEISRCSRPQKCPPNWASNKWNTRKFDICSPWRKRSFQLPDAVQKSRPRMEIDRSEGVKTTKSTKTSYVSKSQNRFNKSFIEFYQISRIQHAIYQNANQPSTAKVYIGSSTWDWNSFARPKPCLTCGWWRLVDSFAHSKLFGPNLWLIVQAQAYSTCSFLQFLTFLLFLLFLVYFYRFLFNFLHHVNWVNSKRVALRFRHLSRSHLEVSVDFAEGPPDGRCLKHVVNFVNFVNGPSGPSGLSGPRWDSPCFNVLHKLHMHHSSKHWGPHETQMMSEPVWLSWSRSDWVPVVDHWRLWAHRTVGN